MGQGKKLVVSLMVQDLIDLKHLPEPNRSVGDDFGFMTLCASFLSSAVEPVDSPEELQETMQEEQLLLASFNRTLMLNTKVVSRGVVGDRFYLFSM